MKTDKVKDQEMSNGTAGRWQKLINSPKYFWDEESRTLGLDGDWGEVDCFIDNGETKVDISIDIFCKDEKINQVYLGKHYYDKNHRWSAPTSRFPVSVDPENKNITAINGIPVYKKNGKPFLDICDKGMYKLCRNGEYGIIDEKLNQITPFKYRFIWLFHDNGLCQVTKDNLYGYVNLQGEEQIPVEYEDIYCFEDGVTTAKKNGLYGIIDEHNNIIHPFDMDYSDMREFRNGYATMRDKKGKWGAVDTKGNVVIPCIYDDWLIFDEDGTASTKKDGEYLRIDTTGKRIK